LSPKDISSESKKLGISEDELLEKKYIQYAEKCSSDIKVWNIPVETDIDEDSMIATIWYIITLYCLQDTRIPYQIITYQSLIPMLCQQSSIFSVDIIDVLMRGQVYTTSSSQYRYNYRDGFMMDFGSSGGPTGAYPYEGGYVGKGEPGLKIVDDDSIIFVIDFASLYPTIIIAHNLCYTTYTPESMRCPYRDDGSENPDYIWNRYRDVIPVRMNSLSDELLRMIQKEIDKCTKDEEKGKILNLYTSLLTQY